MTTQQQSYSQSLANFQPDHIKEFRDSAITSEDVVLNFTSFDAIEGSEDSPAIEEAFLLLIPEPKHSNNNTLAGTSQQELAAILRSGGWFFKGHIGACVKPDEPRTNDKGKVVKYESPRGKGALQLFVPHVSAKSVLAIGTKFDRNFGSRSLSPDSNRPDFWDLFLGCNDIPIIISEGAKDAVGAISAGYPTISLCGIWGFGSSDKDMFGEIERDESGNILKTLHPELEQFVRGREVIFAFDRDSNPDTVKTVDAAKKDFRRCLEGVANKVTDIKWNNKDGKGISDFIAAKGVDALNKAFAKRIEVKLPIPKKEKPASLGFSSSIETGLVAVALGEDGKALLDKDDKPKSERIGNHLIVIATLDNPDGNGSAFLLEFKTFKGTIGSWTMPREYMAGDGSLLIQELYKRKYSFIRDKKAMLLDYLSTLGGGIEQEYVITDSSGWVDKSFVLPHKTHGDENLRFRDVEPSPDVITEVKGTLQGWKDNVAARCAGNSRLILGLGASFAAPLLPILDIESGGFHLVGGTSQGKTIILSVAASVTGIKDIPHWRTTSNGLESVATAFNHLCLPLDEIGQADPRDVGNIAYMLGNGQGKARMTKNLINRKPKTWKLIFLSSGEVSLGNFMAQANVIQKGGQEVRLPDVPAIPDGSKYGCFETIHGAESGFQFASALEAAVIENRGTALDTFLSRLVIDIAAPSFAGNLSKQLHLTAAKLSEGNKDSAIGRVAKRFALVQVALGLAHKYDLLPFDVEQIDWAISECFDAWLASRGGDGSIEIKQAIKRIEHLLVTNEFSDRMIDPRDGNTKTIRNLLAIRRLDLDGQTQDFLIPPSVFDDEFCKGVNKAELLKELYSRGQIAEPETDGRFDRQVKINKQKKRFYILLAAGFGNHEKALGTLGTLGTPSETQAVKEFQENKKVPNDKNTLGTLGTLGVKPENKEGTQGTQAKKGVGYDLGTNESVAEKALQPLVPEVPKVPKQKQDFPAIATKNIEIIPEVPEGEF
jgi:putative DNA primase/helicase